jgi:hypothetical protein
MFQERVVKEIKAHIVLAVTSPPPENHAFLEIMWKYIVEWGRPHAPIWRMRFAYWIPKATNTNSEYIIIIYFP